MALGRVDGQMDERVDGRTGGRADGRTNDGKFTCVLASHAQHGESPLHMAARCGHVGLMPLLLASGADVDGQAAVSGEAAQGRSRRAWHGEAQVQTSTARRR
eukprot:355018-Chlamydomonas_euryale.AAC.4